MKFFRIVPLLVLASIPAALTGCGGKDKESHPPALEVPAAHPLANPIVEWDEYTGRFEATHRVEVRARVSGYIDSIHFKDGQRVKKDDVLFIIDPRPFKIALTRAKAELQQAEAEYRQAKNDFTRSQQLFESKAVSAEEFDQRQQTMFAAEARVEAVRSEVDKAALELEFTEVKSPIDGQVSRDFVHEGNLISGGSEGATLLTTVIAYDPIYFYFEASEAQYLKYMRMNQQGGGPAQNGGGNPVFVKLLDEEDFRHEGRLDFVDNELDAGTGTIQFRGVFDNKDHVLEPGLFGRARIMGSPEYTAILVPDRVISTDQSQKFVYVVGENNTVEMRKVKLGPLHQKEFRVIREGLSAEDVVIIGNIQKVRPDMPVTPAMTEITREEKPHGPAA